MIRAVLFALLLGIVLRCQNAPVFRADVNLLVVPCSVTDERGVAVTDLDPDEFHIFDNGVLQRILHIAIERDLPLTLGVIIDVSSSQHPFAEAHRKVVRQFLERIIRNQDRAFVAEVAQTVTLRSEVTRGPYGLRDRMLLRGAEPLGEPCPALRGRSLCGGTALWDAVYAAAGLKLQPTSGSKALVILSDGNDTGI